MVETIGVNGADAEASTTVPAALPEFIHVAAVEARRIPAPGTQRELRAQTGHSWDELCGPAADTADRIQTLVWMKLRREFPGLRWEACADVGVEIEEGALDVDPTKLAASEPLPRSAGSGD